MTGVFARNHHGRTHKGRKEKPLMISLEESYPHRAAVSPSAYGATAGPRSSIKTSTVAQRRAAKSHRETISQKLRRFLIHRRAATSNPRSKGR